MKKSIIAFALAIAAAGVSSASAQDKMYRPQQFTDFAFEGILLDIDQQTKIDSINSAIATPMAPGMRPDGDKCRQHPGKMGQKPGKPGKKGCDKAKAKDCDKACDKAKDCDKACDKKGNNAKQGKKMQVRPADQTVEVQAGEQFRGPRGHKGMRPDMRHEARPEMRLMPGIEYIISVKEVLTPEQFETFLNNLSSMPACQAPACPAQSCGK